MAGGVTGGQAPSSIHATTTNSLSANDHLNEDDLFMHSNASDLLPYDFSSANSVSNHTKIRNDEMTSQTPSMQHEQLQQHISDQQKLATSHLSKGFSDETSSSVDIFANKKRGKTKKKSNSTISSNTSSSYSSSSGVESMTAGITGECNNMSDKDKTQETCSVIDTSKETMYAVGQWLRFLQMDTYLQEFLDNGYDDLETVKQIGTEDLDAIGVTNKHHRAFVLDAVRVLREQGAVWVYLLQSARDNLEIPTENGADGQYNPVDSLLNHSGSSIETSYRDRLSGGSGNGFLSSYPSSANSSVFPWCPNGADSNNFGLKITDIQSPKLHEQLGKRQLRNSQMKISAEKEGHLVNDITGRLPPSQNNPSVRESNRGQNARSNAIKANTVVSDASCNSSPAKFAYKDCNTAKILNTQQHYAIRTVDENLIQKVSDVMQMEQNCDKLMKVSVDNGLNTTSSTSSNHSQKSSESSNSFYASIPNRLTSNQPRECDPVISLMLSNNQPPLQLHSGIYSGLQETNNDKHYREMLVRKELQMQQPTYANFLDQNAVNGARPVPVRLVGNSQQNYSPGTYASSSCLSDREEEDLYDFAAKYEGGRSMQFGRYNFPGQNRPKLSPSGWYKTAKKIINAKNSSKDDLSLIEGPKDWQGYKSNLGSRIGSPLLSRESSDITSRFSTRTRLRPGGPLSNVTNSRESYLRSPLTASGPNRGYMATMRNGSLPSMTMCEFEEIGMKTMQGPGNQRINGLVPNSPLQEDLYPISTRNQRDNPGRYLQSPATPLVKMRTNKQDSAFSNGTDLYNPRVQMYGTRVVYSDKDSNASAGIITSNKHGSLVMAGNKSDFGGIGKNISEAAV